MTLPAYDSTKHHIGLAPVGDPLQGLILSGGYRRDPQRYGGSIKYGGSDDQIGTTTLSRWSQDDFSGGGYEERFKDDAAMFLDSKNVLPHQVDDTARTVPPLLRWASAGTILKGGMLWGGSANIKLIDVFGTGGKILVIDTDKFRFYSVLDASLTQVTDPDWDIQAAAHDPADNKTYAIVKKPSDSTFAIKQVDPSDGSTVTIKLLPAEAQGPCFGMTATAGRDLLISMNNTLWLADVNDARDDATLTRLGRLPGRWRASVTHAGMTYMLLTDAEQHTQLVSWDGTQVLPVTDFPYNFIGNCVEVYGGRLYVAGTATDTAGTERYAEVYEVTGASLRMLRTFASEARAGLNPPTTIYDMATHEGLLFFGTDKGYLMAYDLTRDALWPQVQIHESSGRTIEALSLLSTRERLFVYGYDTNRTTPKDGFYRMAAVDADLTAGGTGGAGVDVTYTAYVETSEFSPEPDRQKRWSQLRVISRYSPAPTLEYSQDGGATWTALAATSSAGTRFITTDFDLSGLAPSPSIRFRFSFSKNTVAYSELVAFTCSFAMLENGKSGWAMSVLGTANTEQLDGTLFDYNGADLKATLKGYWDNHETLTFRDTDGTNYTVYISDLSESKPSVGPDGESFYSLQFTEL